MEFFEVSLEICMTPPVTKFFATTPPPIKVIFYVTPVFFSVTPPPPKSHQSPLPRKKWTVPNKDKTSTQRDPVPLQTLAVIGEWHKTRDRLVFTTGANSEINQSEFLTITCNLLKAREKSSVQGAIGFGGVSHWLNNWQEIFKPTNKRVR